MPFADEAARSPRFRSSIHAPVRRRSAHGAGGALIAACATLILAGCAADAPFAVLDRELGPADALPEPVRETAMDRLAPGSQRLLGERAGTSLWLASSIDRDEICLLAYLDAVDWVLACGGGRETHVSGPTGTFAVVPDGASPPEGFEAISENVSAPAGG